MNVTMIARISLLALLAASALPLCAKPTPDELARLGKDLTPVGAEAAGNKDGTIPAWTGGVTKPPAGFDAAKGWVAPFADDKPVVTITAANMEKYKDKMTPGQTALMKKYPEYKMNVYPTHRTAGYPDSVYAAVKAEAAQADTGPGGNNVLNVTKTSVPFPIPKKGVEVIWNNAFRYRGSSVVRHQTNFVVQTNGAFTPVRLVEWLQFPMALKSSPDNTLQNGFLFYRTTFTAPSSIAGESILTQDFIDQVKQPRRAWVYNPGSRRVLRAPELSYDSPFNNSDALATLDDYDGYNGTPDRFDFKLIGKKEMYVAYNNYRLSDKKLKYKDIIRPNTINQDLVRYELHRVWVVEGTLRSGANHIYGKRVYYVDEDSWQIVEGDLYDGRGDLWRVQELYGMQFYDSPCFWIAGSSQYDLPSRRYFSSGLTNEEKPIQFNVPMQESDFTTGSLKRN